VGPTILDALPFAGAISGLTISGNGHNFRVTISGFRVQYLGCVVKLSGAFSGVGVTTFGCIWGVVMLIRMGMGGQLSGSVGGVVASHNKGGQYLRNRSVPVNPNSAAQQAVRATFSAAALSWSDLTTVQREAWEAYAVETPVLNRLGESITVSGFNMYCRAASFVNRVAPATSVAAAPATPGLISLGPDLTVVLSAADGITITDPAAEANGVFIVQVGPPVSFGVKFFRAPFTAYVTGANLFAASGVDQAVNVSPLRYGPLVFLQRRFFRIRAASSTFKLSNTFEGVALVGS